MKTCKKTKKAMKTLGHRIRTDNKYAQKLHMKIASAACDAGVERDGADLAAREIMFQLFNAQNYTKPQEPQNIMSSYEYGCLGKITIS